MAGAAKHQSGGSQDVLVRIQKAWGESPFYQARLRGPAPDRMLCQPEDPFTPDKDFAFSFSRGRMALGEESVDCEGELETIWTRAKRDGPLDAFFQEFSWLRHLETLGDSGRPTAQLLVKAWLDHYEKWSAYAWAPYFVSERLVQLCSHHPIVLSGRDAMWRSRVLSSMARQTRHLAHTAHRADTGFDRLMTALGLCVAGFSLPGCEGPAERGVEMVRRELRLQLRADGGHISRNPSRQLKLAVRLQTVLKVIETRGFQPPGFLRHTLLRTNAMASFFRCADGRLAVFNGGYEDDPRALLFVQKAIDPEVTPASFARHSGYHKLKAGRALVIADTGDNGNTQRYKSAGSFHFSSGRSRVFVNCGNGGHRALQWRKALEQRAAHSALSFDEGLATPPAFGPATHRRAEDGRGQLLEYERQFILANMENARYMRRLYLSAGGADLRGEEYLDDLPEDVLAAATWRFHLHPSVKTLLARDKKSAVLLLPNKEGWRFKSNCPLLALEKSVYCGDGGAPVSTEQIVIKGGHVGQRSGSALCVKWALRRQDAV